MTMEANYVANWQANKAKLEAAGPREKAGRPRS